MLLPRENTEIDGGHKTVYQLVSWHTLLAKSYAVNTMQSIGTLVTVAIRQSIYMVFVLSLRKKTTALFPIMSWFLVAEMGVQSLNYEDYIDTFVTTMEVLKED